MSSPPWPRHPPLLSRKPDPAQRVARRTAAPAIEHSGPAAVHGSTLRRAKVHNGVAALRCGPLGLGLVCAREKGACAWRGRTDRMGHRKGGGSRNHAHTHGTQAGRPPGAVVLHPDRLFIRHLEGGNALDDAHTCAVNSPVRGLLLEERSRCPRTGARTSTECASPRASAPP